MILHHHLALRADHHRQRAAISTDLAEQHGGALVDEALGEAEMERVGEPLLDRRGACYSLLFTGAGCVTHAVRAAGAPCYG